MKIYVLAALALFSGFAVAMGTPPQSPAKGATPTVGAASVMLRDDDLRARPDAAAPALTRLAKGSAVRVLAGDGGWTQVSASGRVGWVRILSVRGAGSASTADLGALAGAASAGRDPDRVVAVAGVRGLTEETLKLAEFNRGELLRLETYAVGADEAERFARDAALQRRAVAYLPAPAKSDGGATSPVWSWEGN